MNYTRIYFSLIKKAKSQSISGYSEVHHIIPVSLGGQDIHSNLVTLTPRQHFVAHALLLKIAQKRHALFQTSKSKKAFVAMYKALSIMKTRSFRHGKRYINSRLFEVIRNKYYEDTKRFTLEEVKTMFNYYLENNCFFQGLARFKAHFQIEITQRQLNKLFLNNGLSLKQAVAEKRSVLIPLMFKDYVSFNCSYSAENYANLQAQYHYPLSQVALVQLFNLHGLFVKNVENENDIHAMFDYYLEHTLQGEDYQIFQAKFNYTKNADCLKHLFRTNGLSLAEADKERTLKRYQAIYNFFLEHGIQKTEKHFNIKKEVLQCTFSKLGISKRPQKDKGFFMEIKRFYSENQCQKAENYHLIAENFDYTASKSSLLKQFAKFGI